ncbi:MAG: GNAT family N-acetyltransferase [Anaerolineae bacterium]|jgi:ribosomal protein S18 acetylase RimI-like enzyme|nr:GNAT family N-acetyltransferase [Anaerolineae bacterium]
MFDARRTTPTTLVTTYLEMTAPAQFVPSFVRDAEVRIEKMQTIDLNFYLYLYRSVGEQLAWRDRLLMPRSDLREALSKAQVYVLYVGGAPAGYVELAKQGSEVEIAYFGLREEYQGRGLGKHLLSYGIEQAWKLPGTQRVHVHTCNLDGPHALENYRKRGFRVFMRHEEAMPERYQ